MKTILYTLLILMSLQTAWAQQDLAFEKKNFPNDKEGYKLAMDNLKEGNELYELANYGGYMRAVEFFLLANQFNPNNADLNYKIGVCYLKSTQREKSLEFSQKAVKLNAFVAPDIHYNLAQGLHLNNKFDEAIANTTPTSANYRQKICRKKAKF